MTDSAPVTGHFRVPRQPNRARRSGGSALRRYLRDPAAVISTLAILAIVLLVVFADLVAPIDPTALDLGNANAAPSAAHWLGTDSAGRDIWSRVLHGGQLTLVGALVVIVVSNVIGIVGGLLAGYFGGWLDHVGSWLSALLMALPALIVLLAVRGTLAGAVLAIMAFFGVFISPMLFQVVRTAVRGVLGEPYVDAARVSGLSDRRIVFHHVLSAIRAPLIIQTMLIAGMAIGVQSALDFLGVTGTATTWGGMLSEGFTRITLNPFAVFWPALFLGVMTAALILIGNGLRDALDTKEAPPPARTLRGADVRTATTAAFRPAAGAAAEGPLLAVRGLTVRYPGRDGDDATVVSGVDLTIRAGEVVGLVGESGSGKTQTAFSILGLLPGVARVTAGSIDFRGVELLSLSRRGLRQMRSGGIAYVPQEPISNLDPNFTVGQQLTEVLRVLKGMRRAEARRRALELLADVQIREPEQVFRSHPHEISGGMAQRVLIAIALALEPALLIADEPTTALDVTVQAEVLMILRRLQADRGMAMLLVTHDLGVAAGMCDRVNVIRHGEIVEEGDVEQIFHAPRHPYTKELIASQLDDRPARGALSSTTGGAR
ncbi:MAG: ATP-binding cassette domain-containing protein [Candidatus Leucobacter sulfamidivorax]|nr:ATP-binding cassette domain-containing protein [Candidatus Leucobacter sulfamidivorax]